jgi:hypothetical protein
MVLNTSWMCAFLCVRVQMCFLTSGPPYIWRNPLVAYTLLGQGHGLHCSEVVESTLNKCLPLDLWCTFSMWKCTRMKDVHGRHARCFCLVCTRHQARDRDPFCKDPSIPPRDHLWRSLCVSGSGFSLLCFWFLIPKIPKKYIFFDNNIFHAWKIFTFLISRFWN